MAAAKKKKMAPKNLKKGLFEKLLDMCRVGVVVGGGKHTLEKRKKERGITKQRERAEKKKDKGRRETDAYREGENDADE